MTPHRPRQHLVLLATFFAVMGFVPASWLVRVPDIKDQSGASASLLGVAFLWGGIAGIIAIMVAGRLCVRFGAAKVMVISSGLLCVCVVLPGVATSVPLLCGALVLVNLAQATFSIGLNSTGVAVSENSGTAMMPTLYGVFSVAGLAGAAVGGLAADHVSPAIHLGLTAGVGVLTTLGVGTALLRSSDPLTSTGDPAGVSEQADNNASAPVPTSNSSAGGLIVVCFGVLALSAAFATFAMNNWAALHLREDLHTSAAVAGYGYAAYRGATAAGQFLGSWLIRRIGEDALLVGGFLLGALGALVTSWAGYLPGGLLLAFAGYIVLGLGLANAIPITIGWGGRFGGPRGVSRTQAVSGIGVIAQAPLIGLLADLYGLPAALSSVAVLAVLGAALGVAMKLRSSSATTAPTELSRPTPAESQRSTRTPT